MGKNGDKVSMTFCPLQTQIGGPVKMDAHAQMLLGHQSLPIIKVACDRQKCQLWDAALSMCSVSSATSCLDNIVSGIDSLESAIRDINLALTYEEMKKG